MPIPRKLRTSGDLSLALDDFIPGLRQADFRIGVVVDEAHHGFTSATEAVRFYRDVMRPDFTLLITATPDDADVEKFRKAAGIGELHRHRVSRKEAVDAGLIKEGVQCIAYLAPDDQATLADIPATALAEGWRTHNAIKAQLAAMGIQPDAFDAGAGRQQRQRRRHPPFRKRKPACWSWAYRKT